MDPILETLLIVIGLLTPFAVIYGFGRLLGDDEAGFRAGVFGLLFWFLITVVCGIYAFVSASKSPDLVTLKKDEWSCTHTHREMRMVGKILVPVDVCDTYQSQRATND